MPRLEFVGEGADLFDFAGEDFAGGGIDGDEAGKAGFDAVGHGFATRTSTSILEVSGSWMRT